MSEIKVKVRSGTKTLYDTKVYIAIEDSVRMLKKKICDKDENLNEKRIALFYCGSVMEDSNPIYMYNVVEGSTVHVFKKNVREKVAPPKTLTDADLVKLRLAFHSLSQNSSYRGALMKLNKPEVITNVLLTTPGLNKDPVALTLLQHSELLVKLSDVEVLKRISESHPALASAALQIAAAVHEEVLKKHGTDTLNRSAHNNGSDEDMEDLDDSSPSTEARSQSVSRNSSFGGITAAQLASAIASVTTQQSQPSTSVASTSTGNSGNVPEDQLIPTENDFSTQLRIMREMGLTNEDLNLRALRFCNTLELAIEFVLSGDH